MAMTATPQWIARMYPPSTGRDHLGVTGVSSDQILPSLVPGINVLTYHPRYHSFYVFLLDEFWKRDRLRTPTEWTKFFRPREFIFSLAANLCDRPEHGDMRSIVGGQKTGPLAAQRQEAYDTSFDYIKSDLGGYGLYYRSVMAELGLIYPGGPGLPYPVDLPTEGRGKRAAAAFREAVQQTEYLGSFFDVDSTLVPFDVIQEYGRKACLCQSQLPDAPDRDELRDAYLHGGTQARPRRETLRLFLDMASQTEGHEVSQDSFRQLIYYGAAPGGAHYHPRPEVALTHRRWRLYQTREYYAFALNALWCHFCDWGLDQGGDVRPTPLADFWEHVEQALDFDALASRLNLAPPAISAGSRFKQLLEWLTRVVGADHASFDAACGLGVPLNEHRLYRLANEHPDAPEVMVAGMIAMLALILLRFGQRELWLREEWSISRMGDNGRLSIHQFLSNLKRRLERNPPTIYEVAHDLYADYVILQHQLIASGKLPENTFRFRREGDRIRFYSLQNSLAFAASRFDALSTTVYELGLCGDMRLPVHSLTNDGQRLLDEGDVL